jgi:hypothetical protein
LEKEKATHSLLAGWMRGFGSTSNGGGKGRDAYDVKRLTKTSRLTQR